MKPFHLLLAAIGLCSATSKADDAEAQLFTSVTREGQTVFVQLNPARLMLTHTDAFGRGSYTWEGQYFAFKDGERIGFYDYRERVYYDVELRLSAAAHDFLIRTTVGEKEIRVTSTPIK